jgi:hypothetical protein
MPHILKADVVIPSYGIACVGHRVEPRLRRPPECDHAAYGGIHRDAKVPCRAVFNRVHRVVGARVGVLIAPAVTIAIASTPLARLFFGLYLHLLGGCLIALFT